MATLSFGSTFVMSCVNEMLSVTSLKGFLDLFVLNFVGEMVAKTTAEPEILGSSSRSDKMVFFSHGA